jgi:hypothetical protein
VSLEEDVDSGNSELVVCVVDARVGTYGAIASRNSLNKNMKKYLKHRKETSITKVYQKNGV